MGHVMIEKYKRGAIETFFAGNMFSSMQLFSIVKLGKLCSLRGRIGFRGYTRSDITSRENGVASLSPSNILDGRVSFIDCTYITRTKYEESPEIIVQEKDILFTKTGSTIGKTGFVDSLQEKATINPQIALITATECNPHYV